MQIENFDSPRHTMATLQTMTKTALLQHAKGLIECGEQRIGEGRHFLYEAAQAISILEQNHLMSQREIAEFYGKSAGWVNALLKWRDTGHQDHSPFGPTTKAGRVQRAEQKSPGRTGKDQRTWEPQNQPGEGDVHRNHQGRADEGGGPPDFGHQHIGGGAGRV